jgi:hypothetical protein
LARIFKLTPNSSWLDRRNFAGLFLPLRRSKQRLTTWTSGFRERRIAAAGLYWNFANRLLHLLWNSGGGASRLPYFGTFLVCATAARNVKLKDASDDCPANRLAQSRIMVYPSVMMGLRQELMFKT